jgi:rhodanese-related sulfurtransferase
MNRITRPDLQALLDSGSVTLVEALPMSAYDAEHIPGAVNARGGLTADVAATLAPDRSGIVVVDCSGCGRSKVTDAAFERLGYTDVRVYSGGRADWADAGLSLVGTRTEAVAR